MAKPVKSMNFQLGTRFLNYVIGPKIGQGSFGEIYSALDESNGILWAIKTESNLTTKKTLQYEYQILAQVQSSPQFPRLGITGHAADFTFFTMELLGPSLSHLVKSLPNNRLSFSSAIRASYHMLKCIESFHLFGFVHRDIKPGNILTREGTEHPLCLIDFGLAKVYVNSETGQHVPARPQVGFRGTSVYASIHAHRTEDLSRRDDLISWYYSAFELITGTLPWRHTQDKAEIMSLKQRFDPTHSLTEQAAELITVWKHIQSLDYNDAPNYTLIYKCFSRVCQRQSITLNDAFEWTGYLRSHRQQVSRSLKELSEQPSRPTRVDSVRVDTQIDARLKDVLIGEPLDLQTSKDPDDCSCNLL